MTAYYVLFVVIGGIALFSGLLERAKRWGLPTIMVVLFFLMAFRARSVGADTNNYVWLFMSHGMSYSSLADVWASKGDITALYDTYAWVVYQLFPFEQSILVCNSLIICLGVYLFIREFSETEVFSALLYVLSFCYFFAFNGMRQSVAAAIVLMALVCMRRGKYVPEVLLLVVALGIHQTSLVMVPVVIAAHVLRRSMKFGVTWMFVECIAVALAVRVFYGPLFNTFSDLFSRFDVYSVGGGPFSVADTTQGRQAILYVVIAVFMLVAVRMPGVSRAIAGSEDNRVLWLIGSLCVGFGIFCTDYELLARLINYMLPALGCVLGTLAKRLDRGNKTVFVRMGLLTCYFVLCVYMLQVNYSIVVPYRFFWEGI
jgi:hypothetical protein